MLGLFTGAKPLALVATFLAGAVVTLVVLSPTLWDAARAHERLSKSFEESLQKETQDKLVERDRADTLAAQLAESERLRAEEQARVDEQRQRLAYAYRQRDDARDANRILLHSLDEALRNAPEQWRQTLVPVDTARNVERVRSSVFEYDHAGGAGAPQSGEAVRDHSAAGDP